MAYFRLKLQALTGENIHPVRYTRKDGTTIRGTILHLRDGAQSDSVVQRLADIGVVVFDDWATAPASAPKLLKRHLFYESPGYWEREEPRESGRRLVVVRTLRMKLLSRGELAIADTPAARTALNQLPAVVKDRLRRRTARIDPDDGADLEPGVELDIAEKEEVNDAMAAIADTLRR